MTVNSFSITRDGKMNVFETVSYSTTDNVSIYNRNNASLLITFPVFTRGNVLYGIDAVTGALWNYDQKQYSLETEPHKLTDNK